MLRRVWTKELPTKAGWYWHCSEPSLDFACVTIFQVYDLGNGGNLVTGHEELKPVSVFPGLWSGPLEHPELP